MTNCFTGGIQFIFKFGKKNHFYIEKVFEENQVYKQIHETNINLLIKIFVNSYFARDSSDQTTLVSIGYFRIDFKFDELVLLLHKEM